MPSVACCTRIRRLSAAQRLRRHFIHEPRRIVDDDAAGESGDTKGIAEIRHDFFGKRIRAFLTRPASGP